jgi:cell division protein FtsB
MRRLRHTVEQIPRQTAGSRGRAEHRAPCCSSVSNARHYRTNVLPLAQWLKIDQAKRLKELERENTRLKRAVADLTLDKLILKEAAEGNF